MNCNRLKFSRHAVSRMFERGLSEAEVALVVASGEPIRDYPDDQPYPSVLLLGYSGTTPIHTVVAKVAADGTCYVITVYVPDATLWSPDYRSRNAP